MTSLLASIKPTLLNKRIKTAFLTLVALALSACVSQQTFNSPSNKYWAFDGKVSIKSETTSQNANIIWQNNDQDYVITLFGPFGQGKVKITKNNNTLTLQQGKHTQTAPTAEALLQKTTGWSLPISNMTYWIRNQPSPKSSAYVTHNDAKQLSMIEQEGWTIRFLNQDEYGKPRKITFTRDNLKVLLVIKNWRAIGSH